MYKKESYEQECLEWQWEQLRFRRKYKDTPGGFQDKETERTAVRQWREEVDRFRRNSCHRLASSEIFSREPFAGREEELTLLKTSLEDREGPVILYGIGGIGKSALAREYIRRYGKTYEHILYLSFRTTIQNMIEDDFDVRISNVQYNKELYENKRKYFQFKYDILKEIVRKEKTLMVVDNCDVEYDKDMEKLFSLPCHILVTSRRHPSAWGDYGGIQVGPLKSQKEWDEFVRCYRIEGLSENRRQEFDDYRKKVEGHTLLTQQKVINPDEEFSGLEEFQKDLFKRLHLKAEEKKAMTYLSIMPVQGVPKKIFLTISGISEQTIDHLERCIMAQQVYSGNWQDDMIFLHPIIGEGAREIFNPTTDNCCHLIRGFADYLYGEDGAYNKTWNNSYRDNQKMEPYVSAFVKAFPKPAPWLAEKFDQLVTFLWIQGYYEEAEQYSKDLYQAVKEYYGECHQITGQMALRLAAVYHNSLAHEKSREWYIRGVEILEKCKPFNQLHLYWLASGYGKVARLLWHDGDMDGAKKMIEKGIESQFRFQAGIEEKTESLVSRSDQGMAYLLLEKGRIHLKCGEIEKAEEICEGLFREYSETRVMKQFRINDFTEFRIRLLMERGEYEQAENWARENVERAIFYRGKEWKDTMQSKKLLAHILRLEGKIEEARRLYDESFWFRLQIGGDHVDNY